MKQLLVIAVLAITLFSCTKQARTDLASSSNEGERVKSVIVKSEAELSNVLTAKEFAVVKENNVKVREHLLALRKKNTPASAGTPIVVSLGNNGDGSYTWVYATLAPGDLIIYTFFRWGAELSPTSGNVIAESSVSYYYPNTSTTTSPGYLILDPALWKQTVVITGDFSLDANGVVGSGWAVSYSNPVQ